MKDVRCCLDLDSKEKIVLRDIEAVPEGSENFHRNIYKLNPDGNIAWQVGKYKTFPTSTFVSIYIEDGDLFAYNFDGGEYKISKETGEVISSQLLR